MEARTLTKRMIVRDPKLPSKPLLTPLVAHYIRTDKSKLSATSHGRFRFNAANLRDPNRDCLVSSEGMQGHTKAEFHGNSPFNTRAQARQTLGSCAPSLQASVQSVDFNMKIMSRRGERSSHWENAQNVNVLHVCTEIQSAGGAQMWDLEQVGSWRGYFPKLQQTLAEPTSQGCDVILFESSLSVMPGRPQDNHALSIHFEMDVGCSPLYGNWQIRSTFYEDIGKPAKEVSQHIRNQRKGQMRTKLVEVPLHSKWWVKLLEKVDAKRQEARRKTEEGRENLKKSGHVEW